MDTLRATALIAATLATGLVAGLYFSYACSVMPALRGADDRTFVDTMQRINVAIVNGWFLLAFLGAAVLGVLAAVLHFGRGGFGWVVAGTVLYLATIVMTGAVNIPLNNALDAAGDPAANPDLASVRAAFETTWVRWNTTRAVTSTAGFLCLVLALRA
ncbi:MAG TPA: anthrone oxygenase family protein [Umezawaea sp.]|nr:anthrone oxygenase family protein [Umezawaea sp.]